MQNASPCSGNACSAPHQTERLLLDLYCAEELARDPHGLSLRKLWAPFDPAWRDARRRRGYYVLFTEGGRLYYQRFRLTDLPAAHACFRRVRAQRAAAAS